MEDQALVTAAMPPPPVVITPDYKAEWNKFLNFLNEKGVRGSKELDQRDTNLGRNLMSEYTAMNPKTMLNYDMVKEIQQNVLKDWELAKKIQTIKGVQSTTDDRPLSEPDGWLGSKTSNGYFPTATTTDSKGKVIKDWGHDLEGYYKSLVTDETKKIPMVKLYANK